MKDGPVRFSRFPDFPISRLPKVVDVAAAVVAMHRERDASEGDEGDDGRCSCHVAALRRHCGEGERGDGETHQPYSRQAWYESMKEETMNRTRGSQVRTSIT